MQPSFAKEPEPPFCKIDMDIEKMDNNRLKTYKIVMTLFQVDDKDKQFYFFKKTLFIN